MSDWADHIQAKDLGARTAEMLEILGRIDASILEPSVADGVLQLDYVAQEAQRVVASSDLDLVSVGALNALEGAIQSALEYLRLFDATGDAAHLPNAINLVNQLRDGLAMWPKPSEDGVLEELRRSIGGVRASVTRTSNDLDRDAKAVRAEVEAARADTARLAADAASQIEALASTRTAELQARIEELTQRVDTALPRLDEAIRANQSEFAATQSAQQKEAQEQLKRIDADAQEAIAAANDGILTVRDTAREQAVQWLAELERLTAEAKNVVGAIGQTGTTYAYQEHANSESKTANVWRVFAVILGLAACAVLALVLIFDSSSEDLTSSHLTAKIALAAAIGAIATYAARQSASHRRSALEARRRELALKSLPAYLESLNDDQANALREALAFVYFVTESEETLPRSRRGDRETVTLGSTVTQFAYEVWEKTSSRAAPVKVDDGT